jgi:DNA invertase Pin-like site-specific DNA recombinase
MIGTPVCWKCAQSASTSTTAKCAVRHAPVPELAPNGRVDQRLDETRRVSGDDARCNTDSQDLTAQRNALTALGVKANRIYVDHGLTGTNRARPGLREALAACRTGDTLVVTKLNRLARSLTDARNIVEELTTAGVKLNIGGSVHDPNDPVGRLLFNVLGMIAEFESDLIRMRTREGMKIA